MYNREGTFQRPENALKRAEELEHVGQKQAALQVLYELVTNRKHKQWQKSLEDIMHKYIDLCVELKKGKMAKEGLNQYRNICQNVNVASLEEVIRHFLDSASERARAAQAQADATLESVADLEADASPEDIMLSYVTDEGSAERKDRELVTPWFKFLWEAYRSALDVLKNNARLEGLYASTAGKAFSFCLTYKRTTEFRRLCDMLRNHLAALQKPDQYVTKGRERPDLTVPETLQAYLETRFDQLTAACDLSMWQEAFKTVEDIQGIIQLAKRMPQVKLMVQYYGRLAEIFRRSDAPLFHGFALVRMAGLALRTMQLDKAELQLLASNVVLAALAVLPYDRNLRAGTLDPDHEVDRCSRMAALLGYAVEPGRDPRDILSRRALLNEIVSKDFLSLASEPVRAVYDLLEGPASPMDLCRRLAPHLENLAKGDAEKGASLALPVLLRLSEYVPGLQEVSVLRMLQQLQGLYSSMRLDRLCAQVPFLSPADIERTLVEGSRHGLLKVRIDHRHRTMAFTSGLSDLSDLREHLSGLARGLTRAVTVIQAGPDARVRAERSAAVSLWTERAAEEHNDALARKAEIEARKEEHERQLQERERLEEARRLEAQRLSEAAEAQRVEAERRRRELEAMQRELEEKENEEARQVLESAKKRGLKIKEGSSVDRRELVREAAAKQLEEHQELLKRLARAAKTLDHLERARREVEAPLIEEHHRKRWEAEEEAHKRDLAAFIEDHRTSWETGVAEKKRLVSRMLTEARQFTATVLQRRREEATARRAERTREVAAIKATRHEVRVMARKREYLRREAEAEERAKREEEERARRERERAEEEDRRKKEEVARNKAGYVPPHLRGKAGGGSDSGPPPSRESRAPEGDRWARRDSPADGPRPERSGTPGGGPGPAAGAGGSDSTPPAKAGGGGAGYVPPHLRGRNPVPVQGAGAAAAAAIDSPMGQRSLAKVLANPAGLVAPGAIPRVHQAPQGSEAAPRAADRAKCAMAISAPCVLPENASTPSRLINAECSPKDGDTSTDERRPPSWKPRSNQPLARGHGSGGSIGIAQGQGPERAASSKALGSLVSSSLQDKEVGIRIRTRMTRASVDNSAMIPTYAMRRGPSGDFHGQDFKPASPAASLASRRSQEALSLSRHNGAGQGSMSRTRRNSRLSNVEAGLLSLRTVVSQASPVVGDSRRQQGALVRYAQPQEEGGSNPASGGSSQFECRIEVSSAVSMVITTPTRMAQLQAQAEAMAQGGRGGKELSLTLDASIVAQSQSAATESTVQPLSPFLTPEIRCAFGGRFEEQGRGAVPGEWHEPLPVTRQRVLNQGS